MGATRSQQLGRRTTQGLAALAVAIFALIFAPTQLSAQSVDALGTARQAIEAGRRSDALASLTAHLVRQPGDVDARLLYGLVLSWEKRYHEARVELHRVLAEAPQYLDARVALMNVEWWSGQHRDALELAREVLTADAGNPQARLVRQRLDRRDRPWELQLILAHDRFNLDRESWNEQAIALSRQTPAGAVVVRASHAARFSRSDEQFEVEFYPVFRPGTYAFITVGGSPDHTLYAKHRLGFDFYQNVGKGVELSGGYRRLGFVETTHIYLGSVTKYLGSWMLTGKAYHVPVAASTSPHALVRRYFGTDGTSFVGVGYSHGLVRDDVRSSSDLITLDADIVRGQFDIAASPRWRVQMEVATSREQLPSGDTLHQHTFTGGMRVRF